MFRISLVTAAAVSALIVSACSKPAAKTDTTADAAAPAATPAATPAAAAAQASMTAADFVTRAASSDMFEITEAKVAEKKATSADVKSYAAMMIKDHTESTTKLKAAIAKANPPLTLPPTLPTDMQAKVADLNKASGADFDKTYISQQVDAHTATLGVMQGYATGGDTPALKDFAAATSKVVQSHLDMANKLQASMAK